MRPNRGRLGANVEQRFGILMIVQLKRLVTTSPAAAGAGFPSESRNTPLTYVSAHFIAKTMNVHFRFPDLI